MYMPTVVLMVAIAVMPTCLDRWMPRNRFLNGLYKCFSVIWGPELVALLEGFFFLEVRKLYTLCI